MSAFQIAISLKFNKVYNVQNNLDWMAWQLAVSILCPSIMRGESCWYSVYIQHNSFLSAIVDHCQETAVIKLFTIESQFSGSEAGELA